MAGTADGRSMTVAQGPGSWVLSMASHGRSAESAEVAVAKLHEVLGGVDCHDPAAGDAAAEWVGSLPPPDDGPLERAAHDGRARSLLNMPSPMDELSDQLRTREWLQLLAAELRGN